MSLCSLRYWRVSCFVAKAVAVAWLCAAVGGGVTPATSAGAPAPVAAINGVWLTERGEAKIRIAACGPALCGTIAWLAEPNDSSGRPKTDVNNSDAAKRARPLVGLTIFTELRPNGEAWRGKVYNADDGKDYDVELKRLDAGHATVKGCLIGEVFCGDETWTRG